MIIKKAYIYIHINKINGKAYVGQTVNLPKYRWGKNGSQYSKQPKFYRAIKKYGWENFEHKIIPLYNVSQERMNELEKHYISLYSSVATGYNVDLGGKTGSSLSKSVSQFSLMGSFIKTWQSMKLAAETLGINKSNLTYCAQGVRPSAGGFIWRYTSTETVLPQKHQQRKSVSQYDMSGKFIKTWQSQYLASKTLNINNSTISLCCQKKSKSAGGFVWRYEGEDF